MDQTPDRKVLLGRYELGEVIGTGGMGEVRAARDLTLDRPVAIKFLHPHLDDDPEVKARFDSEAKAAARLTHPNIVAVFDSGEDEGVPFIVMERLSGTNLADRVAAGPLKQSEVRRLGLEMLSALEASHEKGIVHRDLKPGNVMLTENGVAKVADFGIAKAVEGVDVTATGMTLGTPAYLAPERVAGEPATPASDVYSVGVVMYELLTGKKPFEADTPLAMVRAIQQDEPEPLGKARPGVNPILAGIVETAMAKNPRRRFSSAAEMRQSLENWIPDAESDDTGSLMGSSTRGILIGRKGFRGSRVLAGIVIVFLAIAWPAYVLRGIDRSAPGGASPSPTVPDTPPVVVPVAPPLQEALRQLQAAIAETGASGALGPLAQKLTGAVQAGDRLLASEQLRLLRDKVQLLSQQGALPVPAVDRLMAALFAVDLQIGTVIPPLPVPSGSPAA